MIPWDNLKSVYNQYNDLFIEKINRSPVVINYQYTQLPSDALGDLNQNPGILDEYGGRVPLDSMVDRFNQTGTNYQVVPNTEIIYARTYWDSEDRNKSEFSKLNFVGEGKILKINSYTSDNDKLNNASFIEVSGFKLKSVSPPLPYGFDKRMSISYWVTFNG